MTENKTLCANVSSAVFRCFTMNDDKMQGLGGSASISHQATPSQATAYHTLNFVYPTLHNEVRTGGAG